MATNSGQRTSTKVTRRHGCAHPPAAQKLAEKKADSVFTEFKKAMEAKNSNG